MKPLLPGIPGPLSFALTLIAGMMLFLVYDQQYWWNIKEDYTFGYIVPIFVGYVLFDRWPQIRQAVASPLPGPANPLAASFFNLAATLAIFAGGVLFLFGALLRASLAQPPASLALTAGMASMALGLIYLLLPEGEAPAETPRGPLSNPRFQTTAIFLFPILIWFVSAPMLGIVETQINIFLMNKVAFVVYNLFNFIGIPIIQEGNVLRLGEDNVVGVAEACSGIRSLTACIFAGSFLGAVFLRKYWKKVVLLVAGALLAVFTNILRSVFLTGWAYANGSGSIEGTVHDVTGYAVLAVTTLLLLCLLPVLNFKLKVQGDPQA